MEEKNNEKVILQEPDKGLNLAIDNFKMELVSVINNSGLPIGIVYYIMESLYKETQTLYNDTVNEEYREFSEKSKIYIQNKEKQEKQEQNN